MKLILWFLERLLNMRRRLDITSFLLGGSLCYLVVLWNGHQASYQIEKDLVQEAAVSSKIRVLSSFKKESSSHSRDTNKFGDLEMKLAFQKNPGDNRPPYDSLFDEYGNLTSRVSSLLHYAVIGFGKCGTTSVISWLDKHNETQSYPREIYDLMFNQPKDLVDKIYKMPVGNYKRGYKSPVDMSLHHTMRYFREYWPNTKLIVGVRHPVEWFQSMYNFRIQNLASRRSLEAFPKPNDLIGRCFRSSKNTCTYKGEFGSFLRNLGKTLAAHNPRDPITGRYNVTEFERRMLAASRMKPPPDIQAPVPNPVFLFEMRQLSVDDNAKRRARFQHDMEQFLELETPLPPMLVWQKPGKKAGTSAEQVEKDAYKIDICDDKHIPVRKDLMRMARSSSVWIRNYLLDEETLRTSGLVVSSPEYFRSLIKDWMVDPCGEEATKQAGRYILQAARKEQIEQQKESTVEEIEGHGKIQDS